MAIAILVLSFVILLVLGVPIAWCIGLAATLTMLVNIPMLPALTTVAQQMAAGLDSFGLLAIPFFILAGQLMNRGGIAQRLIAFARALVGGLPGGLAHVNIIAAMLFGAIAGSAVAAASAIGGTVGRAMEEEGYDREFSAAVNITSSTTGLIIPPSNILIVYSLASGGVSIAALFLAGYLPGLLVGLTLMLVAAIIAKRKGYVNRGSFSLGEVGRTFVSALPSLFLLVVVIGGIVGGLFTATEASAVAVPYCLILGFLYKELKVADLAGVVLEAVGVTAIVAILIATSISLSWIMAFEDIPQDITAFLLGLSDNPVIIMLVINFILLSVGVFMDMTPAVLIFTPIFLPVAVEIGLSPVHFGIVMILNLCIGLCTPPVGSVLFVGVGVAGTTIRKVVRPLLPFFVAMLVVLLIVTLVPGLSTWLPSLFGF